MVHRNARTTAISPNGVIWVGSEGGFSRYEPDYQTIIGSYHNTPAPFLDLSNYPNPFNAESTIEFSLKEINPVSLIIYTMTGQQIRRLVTETLPADVHRVIWDGTDNSGREVSSGIYIYQVQTGGYAESNKMMLMR